MNLARISYQTKNVQLLLSNVAGHWIRIAAVEHSKGVSSPTSAFLLIYEGLSVHHGQNRTHRNALQYFAFKTDMYTNWTAFSPRHTQLSISSRHQGVWSKLRRLNPGKITSQVSGEMITKKRSGAFSSKEIKWCSLHNKKETYLVTHLDCVKCSTWQFQQKVQHRRTCFSQVKCSTLTNSYGSNKQTPITEYST